jgi:anti-sigma regulatory factor (Ser/Thr protein kinase)
LARQIWNDTVPEPQSQPVVFRVREAIDTIVGMQRVRDSGLLAGLTDHERSTVLTVTSELASNIHKHAGRGSVQIDRTDAGGETLVRVQATDEGPGIPDIQLALQDSFSTVGTLGLGLPGVRRMSHDFSISAPPGRGTHVMAVIRCGVPARLPSASHADERSSVQGWDIGTCVRSIGGSQGCGDLPLARPHGEAALLVLIDGTGHGPLAQRAAAMAAVVVDHGSWSGLEQLLHVMHRTMTGTVGAAVGLLLLDRPNGRFQYAAVGNTTASRVAGDPWRGISREGMIGSRMGTVTLHEGKAWPGDVFVMCTDGIASSVRSITSGQIARHDPMGLAREIVACHGRTHDDAACIVARWSA